MPAISLYQADPTGVDGELGFILIRAPKCLVEPSSTCTRDATYTDNEIATFDGSTASFAYDKNGHMTPGLDPSGDTYKWKDGAFINAQGSGKDSVDLAYDSLGRRPWESCAP